MAFNGMQTKVRRYADLGGVALNHHKLSPKLAYRHKQQARRKAWLLQV
jgi:hypothetical protein